MSDFLGDLAARLDGTAPVLRPRLSALFETPAGEAGFAAPRRQTEPDNGFTIESVEHEAAAPLSQPPAPSRSKPAERSPRAVAPQPDIVADRSEDASPPTKSPRRRTPRIAPSEVEEPTTPPPRAPFVSARSTDTATGLPDTAPRPANPPRRAALQSTPRDSEDAPPARAPFAPALIVPERPVTKHEIAPVSAAPPALRETVALPRLFPAPPPFAPLSPVTQPPRRPEMQASPREAAEPVIHVTIGRIDIQPSGEAPAPRKTRETSPVMSLDDYLRSRAKP
jgi:hypothetical protein